MPNGTEELTPDSTPSVSDHEDSEFYEEIRETVMNEYGWDSLEMIKAMDKIVNYTGLEPPTRILPPCYLGCFLLFCVSSARAWPMADQSRCRGGSSSAGALLRVIR